MAYFPETVSHSHGHCSEIGANHLMVGKRNSDPVAKAYCQAYDRLKKRIDLGYMESDVFDNWNAKAKVMCDKCKHGELSLKEFTAWLDQSSRIRKNRWNISTHPFSLIR